MKTVFIIIFFVLLVFLLTFFYLGHLSKSGKAMGLVNGVLAKCPPSPNSVSSEESASGTARFITPIKISDHKISHLFSLINKIIEDMGGRVVTTGDNYLASEFTSVIFGFVDDFEIRLDPEKKQLHLRSASRVGYSDGGMNRKRAEQFRKIFLRLLSESP